MTTTLEDYLAQLERQLEASPEETDEILREVRSHLELATRDMGRSGADEAAHLARAIERFGTARQIGAELRQVHGRATWAEAGLAVLPLLLFSSLLVLPPLPPWLLPALLAAATVLAWRARWPLWWWAWLGWVPFAVPNVRGDVLWGAAAYLLILVLVIRRDWLQATLALYPLSTAWAFHSLVLLSPEVRNVGWNPAALHALTLSLAVVWAFLLVRLLRTRSAVSPVAGERIARVLEGQSIIMLLNGLTRVAARLWPSNPSPYPYTLSHFVLFSLPYIMFYALPFALFFMISVLPTALLLIQMRARRQRPPSQPTVGG